MLWRETTNPEARYAWEDLRLGVPGSREAHTTIALIQEMVPDRWSAVVGAMMCCRTRRPSSHMATWQILSRYPTPDALAGANHAELAELIKHAGFADQRARTLIAMSSEWTRGKRPEDKLPGCGAYVAASDLIFNRDHTTLTWRQAFDLAESVSDGHLVAYLECMAITSLTRAVMASATEENTRILGHSFSDLLEDTGAAGFCRDATFDLVDWAPKIESEPKVGWSVASFTCAEEISERWYSDVENPHWVALCEVAHSSRVWVVDLTARQFFFDAPVPLVLQR